ncbi:MAG: sodium:solute symporter family protein [Pseudomonadota bacterium]
MDVNLDESGITLVVVYLCSLLFIGYLANRARREASLKDYYLAGGSLGVVGMFFTLYATQYSGNSFFALPGKAYREGIMATAFIVGIMSVVLVYLTYAPRLHRIAKQQQFISVGDFIRWRYDSTALLVTVNTIFLVTLITFILGNLKAVGLLLDTATAGMIPFTAGIILVCLIMAIYETLGGMRSVVWTDIIQGLMLMSGSLLIFVSLLIARDDGVMNQPTQLLAATGEFFAQPLLTIELFSLIALFAFGAGVYPQAIQRVYAARSVGVLKRSYLFMFFMPLVTTAPLFLIGMSAADWFPDLQGSDTEQVVIYAIGDLLEGGGYLRWLLPLYLGAAIAAIMSTIDSALLTMGSIINKDMIASKRPGLSQSRLHQLGILLTWIMMATMAFLAITLPNSIWSLLVLKLEIVIQVFPTIIAGVYGIAVRPRTLVIGLLCGCAAAVCLRWWPGLSPLPDIHAGIWAFGLNMCVIFIMHLLTPRREPIASSPG